MIYKFDDFQLAVDKHTLSKHGVPQKIEPQVFEILVYLISNRERLITKQELHEVIWKGRVVSEAAVNSRIRSARNAIADDGSSQRRISTVHGRGFRFIGDVEEILGDQDPIDASQPLESSSFETTVDSASRRNGKGWKVVALACAIAVSALLGSKYWTTKIQPPEKEDAATDGLAIAVMPFDDMSPAQDMRHLADGFSEELLNMLSQVQDLKVTSRLSSFLLRDSNKNAKELGEILNVTHLLEGSVRRSENITRVTVQLIDTRTDTQIWSKTFDREFDQSRVLAMQDDVASSVVMAISEDLPSRNDSDNRVTSSVQAYEAFLRGNELRLRETQPVLSKALEQYDLAISLDPKFARAYAARSATYGALFSDEYYGAESYNETLVKIKTNQNKALELAPNDSFVLEMVASLHDRFGEHEQVLSITEKLLDIDPNSAAAYEFRGKAMLASRHLDEAHTLLMRARSLNPLSPNVLTALGDTKYLLGDLQGALNVANDNFKWNSDKSTAYELLIYLNREKADYAEAHRLGQEALEVYPKDLMRRDELIGLYSHMGMVDQALAVANTHHLRAWANAINGNLEAARAALELSVNAGRDGELLLMVGDYERARELYAERSRNRGYFERSTMPVGTGRHYFEACFIDTQLGLHEDSTICQQLGEFYENSSPHELVTHSDVMAGAGWHLLNNRIDEALLWCLALADRGNLFLNALKTPLYVKMMEHPGTEQLIKDMQENAKYHQRLISRRAKIQ